MIAMRETVDIQHECSVLRERNLINHVLNLLGVWPIILSVDFYAQFLTVSACPPLPAFPYLLSCLY